MYKELLKDMTEALRVLVEEGDETIALQARMYRKAFDALVAEGFKPDHACLILAHQGAGLIVKQ